jgi:hypothetical protein
MPIMLSEAVQNARLWGLRGAARGHRAGGHPAYREHCDAVTASEYRTLALAWRETRAILAAPGIDGGVTIYLPSQVPHMHRRWIAETAAAACL